LEKEKRLANWSKVKYHEKFLEEKKIEEESKRKRKEGRDLSHDVEKGGVEVGTCAEWEHIKLQMEQNRQNNGFDRHLDLDAFEENEEEVEEMEGEEEEEEEEEEEPLSENNIIDENNISDIFDDENELHFEEEEEEDLDLSPPVDVKPNFELGFVR
jgi:hypothetical protein